MARKENIEKELEKAQAKVEELKIKIESKKIKDDMIKLITTLNPTKDEFELLKMFIEEDIISKRK